MHERANRSSAGRSVVAGAFVLALALCDSVAVQPVLAQTLGRPNVIVDETVLDQLGPPPQTLPDVLLQQQPQAYRPAPRENKSAATAPASQAPDRLLPPPSVMPRSRVMLPGALRPATNAPMAPPQVARVPKAAPAPRPAAAPVAPVAKSLPEPPAIPRVVPAEITPPQVSVPDAPKIAPPPAPVADAPAPAAPQPMAAVPEPSEPPVAKVEMPSPPPAPLAKVEPPAPPVALQSEPPAPAAPEKTETAAIPAPPEIVPPPVSESSTVAPAPEAPVAEESSTPRLIQPPPQETPSKSETATGSDNGKTATQIAALPPAAPAAPAGVLDGGQMYRIPFGQDSSDIPDDGKQFLDELAQRLKSDSALRLQLLGYAGSTQESASKARRTSLFRALSVRTYLMKQGIRSTRMDVRALGNLVEDGAPDRVDAVVRK